jgi:hypothetical protein
MPPADHTAIINTRPAARVRRQMWLELPELESVSQKKLRIIGGLPSETVNQKISSVRNCPYSTTVTSPCGRAAASSASAMFTCSWTRLHRSLSRSSISLPETRRARFFAFAAITPPPFRALVPRANPLGICAQIADHVAKLLDREENDLVLVAMRSSQCTRGILGDFRHAEKFAHRRF